MATRSAASISVNDFAGDEHRIIVELEDAANARAERAGGHGGGSGRVEQDTPRHLGGERNQKFGVRMRMIGSGDNECVAASFAFAADPA